MSYVLTFNEQSVLASHNRMAKPIWFNKSWAGTFSWPVIVPKIQKSPPRQNSAQRVFTSSLSVYPHSVTIWLRALVACYRRHKREGMLVALGRPTVQPRSNFPPARHSCFTGQDPGAFQVQCRPIITRYDDLGKTSYMLSLHHTWVRLLTKSL